MTAATERHREWAAANQVHLREYRKKYRAGKREHIREVAKAWLAAHPGKQAEYGRTNYARNKANFKVRAKRYRQTHREEIYAAQREWYAAHPERKAAYTKRLEMDRKMELIAAYGGKCACLGCNESRWEFMTLDHIYGDGAEHKRRLKTSRMVYREVRKLGYPKDRYRLLCFNCNCCRGAMGYCPHEREAQ
jgi:hypothetical protein